MLVELIRKLRQPAIKVSGLPGDVEVEPDRRGNQYVLAWLIQHAMNHGCIGLKLGVSRTSGELWMNFLGPHWYRQPTWWRIIPPETQHYPILFQVCLSIAEVELGSLPIRGKVPVIREGRRISLDLEINELASFQLTWDKRCVSARTQVEHTGRVFPDEQDHREDNNLEIPVY